MRYQKHYTAYKTFLKTTNKDGTVVYTPISAADALKVTDKSLLAILPTKQTSKPVYGSKPNKR